MSRRNESNIISALDIGTSKITAMIGIVNFEGGVDIIGVGSAPSRGLKKGVVVNIDATVQSIAQAVEEAESLAGCQMVSVFTGIAGNHVRSFNSNGVVAVKGDEITISDIERVMEAAKAVPIPADQKVLHVLPQEYIVDNQGGIRDPIGMTGVRLEARVHIVTGSISAAQNIVKCIRRCDLDIEEMVLQHLASSYGVLSEDEKQLGVCLVDIGGGTTDIVVFAEGTIQHTAVIPVAGDQVTNDIAVALRIPTQHAETVKIEQGCALVRLAEPEKMIEVPSMGGAQKSFSQTTLAEVVEPRMEELFSFVQAELSRNGLEDALGSGIVITGGSARMPGVVEIAEEVFSMPVRLGVPREVSGLLEVLSNPVYSTAVGLLKYGCALRGQHHRLVFNSDHTVNLWGRVKHWVQGYF